MILQPKLKNPLQVLRISLLAGSFYLFLVALFHFCAWKAPFFYIYFNLPSYTYQDKIISFFAFGQSLFLVSEYARAGRGSLEGGGYVLAAGCILVAGLSFINLSIDFHSMATGVDTRIYWTQTVLVGIYVIWLAFLYQFCQTGRPFSFKWLR